MSKTLAPLRAFATRFAAGRAEHGVEATGHSVRFVSGVDLYYVARASAWALGISGTAQKQKTGGGNRPVVSIVSRKIGGLLYDECSTN